MSSDKKLTLLPDSKANSEMHGLADDYLLHKVGPGLSVPRLLRAAWFARWERIEPPLTYQERDEMMKIMDHNEDMGN